MSNPFLGEIRTFAFTFAPSGWALCNGQTLSISQNTALFSLLGTTYGGNGTTTFQLPDLRSRVAIHSGMGSGLSNYVQGQFGGQETVSTFIAHSHVVNATNVTGIDVGPKSKMLAGTSAAAPIYYDAPPAANMVTMDPGMIGVAGSGNSVTNIQPFLTLNFCIALQGIFPSRS